MAPPVDEGHCVRCGRPSRGGVPPVDWESLVDSGGEIIGVVCEDCLADEDARRLADDVSALAGHCARCLRQIPEYFPAGWKVLDHDEDIVLLVCLNCVRPGDTLADDKRWTSTHLMEEAKIIGPFCHRPGTDDRTLVLVQGDQILGRFHYWTSTRTVTSVAPGKGPIRDRLVQEAKDRGLLHGKDIPDYLQHDLEQPDGS